MTFCSINWCPLYWWSVVNSHKYAGTGKGEWFRTGSNLNNDPMTFNVIFSEMVPISLIITWSLEAHCVHLKKKKKKSRYKQFKTMKKAMARLCYGNKIKWNRPSIDQILNRRPQRVVKMVRLKWRTCCTSLLINWVRNRVIIKHHDVRVG